MTILVTGARGMIGSALVKELLARGYTVIGVGRSGEEQREGSFQFYPLDLCELESLRAFFASHSIDRVIHLAALAHRDGLRDLSWESYKRANVDAARNVFSCAGSRPVLFISTIDVYGFYDGGQPLGPETPPAPVSDYGKSKALAERECQLLPHYDIFRLSPVYTPDNKRDIQKRYYLKYPNLAYCVGKGSSFEVLDIDRAVKAMADWCGAQPDNTVHILKDPALLWTPDSIRAEKAAGRARIVLHVPAWCVSTGTAVLTALLGRNEKTYLLNKLVHPLRTKEET